MNIIHLKMNNLMDKRSLFVKERKIVLIFFWDIDIWDIEGGDGGW